MKKLKILMFIITIITIILTIALIILIPKLKNQIIEAENSNYGDMLYIQKEEIDKVYIILGNCIEKYLQYNIQEDENINEILEEYASFEKFDTNYYLKINSVYKIERMDDITYFIETLVNDQKTYFLVNVDYINDTFNIRRIYEQEFKKAQNNQINEKYKKSIRIEKNSKNAISRNTPSLQTIMYKYYETYKKMSVSNPIIAFNILDREYRAKKFDNDIEKYKEYIENNQNSIKDFNLSEIEIVQNNDDYSEYKIKDAYDVSYIIKEYYYTNFTIILDDYTIENSEQIEKYNNLNNEEKVVYNIKKVFSMLDNKEYDKVYNLLDGTFKERNFGELEQFKIYAKENFFDYNVLGNIKIKKQGKNYIATVPYKDGISTAAERKKKSFMVKLLDDANFIISFEI